MPNKDKYPVLVLEVRLLDMPSPVIRQVAVRSGTSMRELHHIVQAIMPWTTSHLYDFRFNRGSSETEIQIGDTQLWDEEMPPENDDRLYYVEDIFGKKGEQVTYTYDMGDDWIHEIRLLDIENDPFRFPVIPCLVAGEGQCPPEDCGGVPGYRELLKTISDKKHPEYQDTMQWLSGMRWKPEKFKMGKIQDSLNKYKTVMWQQYMG
jgi:hypothetical protein